MKLPQGNRLVLGILRSRAHRLLSGTAVELRYTGRRSGREFAVPVQYALAGDRMVLWPQDHQHSTWWRNFREPRRVTVRLAGRLREGTAVVLEPAQPGWQQARDLYVEKWRRFADRVTGPLVVITLGEAL